MRGAFLIDSSHHLFSFVDPVDHLDIKQGSALSELDFDDQDVHKSDRGSFIFMFFLS